jgi:glycosyltransferase involved in cell wall biosynthesis
MLRKYFPKNEYILYSPSVENSIPFPDSANMKIVTPTGIFNKFMKSYWRSFRMSHNIKKDKLDIYHGLSNEVPQNAHKTKAKIFTTIHDLIFFRYPDHYQTADRQVYFQKFKYSAQISNRVIAISEQTKTDVIHFLGIPENKIEVVYQGCNPIFYKPADTEKKVEVAARYRLPKNYILNVGTVEKRKNIFSVVKALHLHNIDIPLLIVGAKTSYQDEIEEYISKYALGKKVLIFNNVPQEDLPALYQMSEMFIFPSLFEGFGIPILEALNSKIPVVTTRGGCFNEAGGMHSVYINPSDIDEIAESINKLSDDSLLCEKIAGEGYEHAQKFNEALIAENLMNLYLNS